MDMPLNTLTLAQSDALRRILDRVASGRDALVAGDDGHALLDAAAEQLAALRHRAIRVSVPPAGLSLSGLMASITGRPDLAAQDDAVLELGFRMLTVRDDGCDGIVLLVSGADRLQRPALRYIQFACRAGRDLRVVLAGAELEDAVAVPELSALRARLAEDAAVAPAPIALKPVAAAPAPPAPPEPAPVQLALAEPAPTTPVPASAALAPAAPALAVPAIHAARVRPAVSARTGAASKARRVAWAAGLGLAASLAFALWATRTPWQPASEQAAMAPAAPVAPASTPAPPVVAVAAAPTEPAPTALPTAPSPESAAPSQEAMPLPPPLAAPPAAPPRASSRRPDTRARESAPVQSLARRPAPAQPRFAQSPPAPAPLEEDHRPAPPRPLRTEDTFGPMYSTLAQPRSFIGTYSANPDGTRAFRMEP